MSQTETMMATMSEQLCQRSLPSPPGSAHSLSGPQLIATSVVDPRMPPQPNVTWVVSLAQMFNFHCAIIPVNFESLKDQSPTFSSPSADEIGSAISDESGLYTV